MIAQLRICVPDQLSDAVMDCSTGEVGVAEVSRRRGASVLPAGDVIHVLLAREAVERLVAPCPEGPGTGLGLGHHAGGGVLSDRADKAAADAPWLWALARRRIHLPPGGRIR